MAPPVDDRTVFGPETLEVLGTAFEEAWEAVPNHFQHPGRLREMLATQIFELAAAGENCGERLSRTALERIFAGYRAAVPE